ncbi:hypothetical protein D9O40_11615 [Clostridium autoethanogenum]|uniref:Uncharacterized protein n=1 Tax=Clostridium autoethanogenum TaxID=84023 RepID=A0A3M0SPZ7_9CLOT|nr:hypothetical protein D9O40_11615 [Clostridium autoethanogenum]
MYYFVFFLTKKISKKNPNIIPKKKFFNKTPNEIPKLIPRTKYNKFFFFAFLCCYKNKFFSQ